ncbi:terpene synthase 5-like [Euphorbia lathyris]|uniref:terpene synthase 5-like n=1 Tax=Euphorbia lathyris TaxID=212925 RepID=UPI00331314E9
MAKDAKSDSDVPLTIFPASLWGSSFASSSLDSVPILIFFHIYSILCIYICFDTFFLENQNAFAQEYESMTKEVETLKETVKDMLIQSTKDLIHNIEFIDLLCRLGVSYHFEMEIDEQLNFIFTHMVSSIVEQNDYNLHTSALIFRILRQHGLKMSCDVFRKFKNNQGEFEKSLTNDVKGILSLYEATFVAVRGEDILDEALSFTRKHLETLSESEDSLVSNLQKKHIKNALFCSFHQNVNRIEARQYISLYEEDDESRNETLLKFAKLDFNRLQSLYNEELGLLSRWWKELNLVENLSHVRDRIVESYFWALGSQFQPQFGVSRIFMAKYTTMVTVIDDTYDSFAQLDQLGGFTAAVQRFTSFFSYPSDPKVIHPTNLIFRHFL